MQYFFLLKDINGFRIQDSFDHLPSSLEDLCDVLRNSSHDFPIIEKSSLLDKFGYDFVRRNEAKKMLLTKSYYPYEWATSVEKLLETKCLPEKSAFDSQLNKSSISDENYTFAKKVFETFGCKDMLDYTRMYVFLDTLILAEVVMRYRRTFLNQFKLDPARYFGVPSLAYDIMLSTIDENDPIELMTDPDMITMVQSGIRGGVSVINQRYAECSEGEDKEKITFTYSGIKNMIFTYIA